MLLFGFIWKQGSWPAVVGVGVVFALSWIIRTISSRASTTRQPGGPRHERVLSPLPAEAAKARARLVWQFTGGMLYLAFISLLLSGLAKTPFLIVFLAVTLGVVFTGTMLLAWATSWAIRKDARKNQFSILTLLLLTLIAAVYLGAIRWFADLTGEQIGVTGAGGRTFLAAAAICTILTCCSLPFLLFLMESIVWMAVSLMRHRWVQGWLRRRM